jgi:hypothetical protein
MEGWNAGRLVFKRILSIFDFIFDTYVTINPTLHYPSTHCSIIPSFHHSNWGEAPNLKSYENASEFTKTHNYSNTSNSFTVLVTLNQNYSLFKTVGYVPEVPHMISNHTVSMSGSVHSTRCLRWAGILM